MGERRLCRILSEDRRSALRSEIGAQRVVGDPIQSVAHLRPRQIAMRIANGNFGRSGTGQFGGEDGHGPTLEDPSRFR